MGGKPLRIGSEGLDRQTEVAVPCRSPCISMQSHPQRPLVIQGNFQGRMPVFALQAHENPVAFRLAASHVQRATLPHRAPGLPPHVLQRQGNTFQVPPSMSITRNGPGQPLPPTVLQRMESFFGANFSDVRIHIGPQALSIGALAFTMGSEIFFAPGQYEPHSARGQRLLGHELTHVVQQRSGRVLNPFGSGVAVVQDQGLEAEAERQGLRVATAPILAARPAQAKPRHGQPMAADHRAPHVRAAVQMKPASAPAMVRPSAAGRRVAHPVIQRLIVVDDDLDTSRLMAAVDIYNKWKKKGRPERISTIHNADLAKLRPGEKLYLVAHGDPETHGDRSATELAALLESLGLRRGPVVKLISCNTGDGESKSYAARLAGKLGYRNKVIGVRGPETSAHGHTRGNQISAAGMKKYEALLAGDKTFEETEKLVKAAKQKLKTCKPEEEEAILLKTAQEIDAIAGPLMKKLEELFKEHVTISSKQESEYVHLPLRDTRAFDAQVRQMNDDWFEQELWRQ